MVATPRSLDGVPNDVVPSSSSRDSHTGEPMGFSSSAPATSPPLEAHPEDKDVSYRSLAATLNDVGSLLHWTGDHVSAIGRYQEAVQVLMRGLRSRRDPAASVLNQGTTITKDRLRGLENEEERLRRAMADSDVQDTSPGPELDLYPSPSSSGRRDDLDCSFWPISAPVVIRRNGRRRHSGPEDENEDPEQEDGGNTGAYESAVVLFNMGLTHLKGRSPAKSAQLFSMCLTVLRRFEGLRSRSLSAKALNHLAIARVALGRDREAADALREAASEWRAAALKAPTRDERRSVELGVADTLSYMGRLHLRAEERGRSLDLARQSLRLRRSALGDSHILVAAALHNVGAVLAEQGHLPAALEHLRWFADHDIVRSRPELLQHRADVLHTIGSVCLRGGDQEGAARAFDAASRLRRAGLGPANRFLSDDLLQLGRILHEGGHFREAMVRYHEALSIETYLATQQDCAQDTEGMAMVLCSIGQVHQALGQLDDALAAYGRVLSASQRLFGEVDDFVASMLNIIGNLRLEMGDTGGAMTNFADALRITRQLQEEALAVARGDLGQDHHDHQEVVDDGQIQGQMQEQDHSQANSVVVLSLLQAIGLEFHPHAAAA